jgi:hypothetical protein
MSHFHGICNSSLRSGRHPKLRLIQEDGTLVEISKEVEIA